MKTLGGFGRKVVRVTLQALQFVHNVFTGAIDLHYKAGGELRIPVVSTKMGKDPGKTIRVSFRGHIFRDLFESVIPATEHLNREVITIRIASVAGVCPYNIKSPWIGLSEYFELGIVFCAWIDLRHVVRGSKAVAVIT